jgi:GGDEF domain-containing protein
LVRSGKIPGRPSLPPLGCGIGIKLMPQNGTNATDILTAADNAMYAAKRSRKGRGALTESTR